MEDQKEWRFDCPGCKSANRLVQQVVDEDRSKNRIDVEEGAVTIQDLPIRSNTKKYEVGDEISILRVFQDICADCGILYTFKIQRQIEKMRRDVSQLTKPAKNLILPRSTN